MEQLHFDFDPIKVGDGVYYQGILAQVTEVDYEKRILKLVSFSDWIRFEDVMRNGYPTPRGICGIC